MADAGSIRLDALNAPPPLSARLGGQAAYILAGNLFTLALGLPLQMFISRTLGAHDLGRFSLLEGSAGAVAGLLGFGLAPAAVRFIPEYLEREDYGSIRRLIFRSAAILASAGMIASLLFVLIAPHAVFGAASRIAPALVALIGVTIPVGLLAYYAQQCLRGFQDFRSIVLGSSFLQLTVKASVTIVALLLGARLLGVVLAAIVSSTCALLWLGLKVMKRVRALSARKQGTSAAANWKSFSLTSYMNSLVSLPAGYIDRFLLGYFAGAASVGVLMVVRQLQILPMVIFQMLLSVSSPMFAAAHAQRARADQEHLYALVTDWAVRAALPLIMFLSIFAPAVLVLFGKDFAGTGSTPVRIIMLAQLINLAAGPTGNMGMMSGLERGVFRIHAATSIGSALMLALLTPFFALLGISLSFLFMSLVSNALMLRIIRTRLGVRWWDPRYLGWLPPALISAAGGFVSLALWPRPGPVALGVSLLAMYAVFLIATLVRGLHDDDRELLQHIRVRLGLS